MKNAVITALFVIGAGAIGYGMDHQLVWPTTTGFALMFAMALWAPIP